MYALNGKLATRNGKFLTRSFNTLSFGVEDAVFPDYTAVQSDLKAIIQFYSDTPNSVEVNYGDGVTMNYEFQPFTSVYRVRFSRDTGHTYQDSNTGERIVSFVFLKPLEITKMHTLRMKLIGAFPSDVVKLKKLQSIELSHTALGSKITSFPHNLNELPLLNELILDNIGSALGNGIPDAFLGLNLETLILNNSTDLSNPQTSNFNKINIFQNTLKTLGLSATKIDEIPEEFTELDLNVLQIGGNKFTTIPDEVDSQVNVKELVLSAGVGSRSLFNYGDISHLINLEVLDMRVAYNITTDIPSYFSAFTKLKVMYFGGAFVTQDELDSAIESMYSFIELNASKIAGNTKFREMNINYGGSFTTPSGVYQQPNNYVQGSNNGDSLSPLECIWVLVNQYDSVVGYNE